MRKVLVSITVINLLLLFLPSMIASGETVYNNVLIHYEGDHSNCFTFSGVADGVVGNFKIFQNGTDVTSQYTASNGYMAQLNKGQEVSVYYAALWDSQARTESEVNLNSQGNYPSDSHWFLNEGNTFTVYADDYQKAGICGSNMRWSLNSSGHLTISGTGEMYDYWTAKNNGSSLWDWNYVYSVDIEDGITSIADEVFYCSPFTSIIIPQSITKIGMCPFADSALKNVYFQGHAPNISSDAFYGLTVTAYYPPNDSSWDSVINQSFYGNVTWLPDPTIHQHTVIIDPAVEATCIATGLTEGKHCSTCNEVLVAQEIVPLKNHTLAKTDKVEPTCIEKGTDTYWTCSVCKKLFKDENGVNEIAKPIEIAALGHHEVIDAAIAPSCLVAGLTEGKHCDRCNTVLVAQQEEPALGHQEVNDPAVAPTCTETGLTAGKHCGRCNAVLTAQEEVPALGHKEVTDAAVEATCTESGLTEGKHCSVCGTVTLAQEVVPKKNHHFVMDAAVQPTCTETGLTSGFHCDICGEVFVAQEIVPTIEHTLFQHDAVPATCTSTGTDMYWSCSVCEKLFSDSEGKNEIEEPIELPKTGHTWGDAVYIWAPDNSSITATHVCVNDSTHKEEKTVSVSAAIVSPTERTRGSASYTSESFNTDGFIVQRKSIPIPMLRNMSVMILPSMLTNIEDEAFAGIDCEAIIVSDKCSSIGIHAFANCQNLLYIRVPANVTIDPDAFDGCEDVVVDRVTE